METDVRIKPLTAKQEAVLGFIAARSAEGKPVPTIREIAEHLHLAGPSTAHQHVKALERRGWLRTGGGLARSLRLEERAPVRCLTGIPLLGHIPAGHGDHRPEERDGMVYVDMEALRLPKGARTFALRVTGDSMIGRHIQDGDLIILEQAVDPRHGDVVAALIDGLCTLKTFVAKGGRHWLKAENPRYPDIIPAAELVIQGVMRTLIRHSPHRP